MTSLREAATVLRRVFGAIPADFAFRLWDGSLVVIGTGEPKFAVAFKEPGTFARILRDPSPLRFAEAFVESAIDIEGDLFAAMAVADLIEELKLSVPQRLSLLLTLWRR